MKELARLINQIENHSNDELIKYINKSAEQHVMEFTMKIPVTAETIVKRYLVLRDIRDFINNILVNLNYGKLDVLADIQAIKKKLDVLESSYGISRNLIKRAIVALSIICSKCDDMSCEYVQILTREFDRIMELVTQEFSYVKDAEAIHARILYLQNLKRVYQEKKPIKKNMFSGKGCVYSAVIGEYDDIKEPLYIDDNLDYILFTDNRKVKSNVWRIVYLDNDENLDNTRIARKIKILGNPLLDEYDYTIWVDGKLQIKGNLIDYINKYSLEQKIICMSHGSNNDIYEEAELCIELKKDDEDTINRQVARYRLDGYPVMSGLVDSCFIVRKHKDSDIIRLMNLWWKEVVNYSKRDQLSFNYCCYKLGIKYDSSDFIEEQNQYFDYVPHVK